MAEPSGERRIVTVLMADVVGSTTIGEALGPERSKFLFDEIVRLMADEVRRFDGTVAQLTGDGLFAIFGAPSAHEDDSERAVRAGLGIHDALARFARDVQDAYGVPISARVGIHTGPVVLRAGDAAAEVRYNALGDTVNTAARLQSLAGDGGVALGPSTARQVEGRFALESLGELELKGKSAPVAAYRVLGERPAEAPALSPFVGRQRELAELEQALTGVAEGRGSIVSVVGEPGIGKSRLVSEAGERVSGLLTFLTGHAVSYAESVPYWPVRDLLGSWLGLGSGDPEARVRIELKAALAALLGEDAARLYPFLANLLGLAADPEVGAALREFSRDSVQWQTHDAASDLVRALARERPLCLVLEDLHWVDEPTLELIEELLPLAEEEAVGLVLLYRSDPERPCWRLGELARRRYRHRYVELELGPLGRDEALALADAELPEVAATLLLDHSGGNPFFLEEALRDLVERGVLRRQNGHYELAVETDELSVPSLVHEALQARLDRLSAETREVATLASVVGRSFGLELLERLAPPETLRPALSELQRLDLVVEERRRPTPEYRFRHGLVREAAYSSLTESRRRSLHRQIGEALEGLQGEELVEAYGLLGRHFSEADEPQRAADYLLKAGDAARAIDAEDDALRQYRKALGFLDRLGNERRARDTLLKIALTHHLAFDFEQADRAYEQAFARSVPEAASTPPTESLEVFSLELDALAPGHSYWQPVWDFVPNLFRGLLQLDRDLSVLPSVASSFRVSHDGLEYRFRLRPDARWSDGVPVTAEDFAYTWRAMRDQKVVTAHLLEPVEEAVALDERTLQVGLREPLEHFLHLMAIVASFPWPKHRCEQLGDDWRLPQHLVGNGPFVLAGDTESFTIVAAEGWPLPRGNVREVCYRVGQGREGIEAWLRGELDLLRMYRTVSGTPAHGTDTVVEEMSGLATWYVGFASDHPPFDDVLVRRAFSHGTDRVSLSAAIEPPGEPAEQGGLIPPAMPGHSHRAGLGYSPELARNLLAEAGYPEGRGLPELTMLARDAVWGERLAERWRDVLGARTRVLPLESTPARDTDAHAFMDGWVADYPSPQNFLDAIREGTPVALARDERIEKLLRHARSLRERRGKIRLYNEVERIWITEQAAVLPLEYMRGPALRRPWVEGFWLSPMYCASLDEVCVRR